MLSSHTLVDLTEIDRVHFDAEPGCLCSQGGFIYCATLSDASIWRLRKDDLSPVQRYAAGEDIECMCLSQDGSRLYALVSGADTLLMLDVESGDWLMSAPVGMHPLDMRLDRKGKHLAVAGGASGKILLLDAETLRLQAEYLTEGTACGVFFAADGLVTLCSVGDYDPQTQIGSIEPQASRYQKIWTVPGLPGCFALGMSGLLVGHLNAISLFNLQHREIRWRLGIQGLPNQIAPAGRLAVYADRMSGRVGVIDSFQANLMTLLRVRDPVGLLYAI